MSYFLYLQNYLLFSILKKILLFVARPHSAVGNVPDCRYVSDCRSRGHELDPHWSPYFCQIDHETFSMVILLPSADSRRVVVNDWREYVHEVLVSCLFKLGLGKSVTR